ncbi:hypothetical protein EYM_00900 [Ignicoccus islandicus DSM 13165]|uniref:Uncharacterized protein n=1 Tax=Ignicoccus islandicus DSM 13165 TaxID=940295 RepID=A0A0U3F939_9CREN|nr:hypothetical protein [Ignicoccus islandicus]ALU12153.1 hypothetical protein EYM_00900 [Ignicoccus islandicus DSM 13165]
MRFRVSSPIIKKEVELGKTNVIYGPPASGKSVLIRYLYLALSMFKGGCVRGHFISMASNELAELMKFSSCSKGENVTCDFEVSLEDVVTSLKKAEFQLFVSLSLPYAELRVEGRNPFEFEVRRICNLRIVSEGSSVETKCIGEKLKGTWKLDLRKESQLPQDLLLEALFEGSDDVAFLPRGRWSLAEVELKNAPLHYKCFSSMFKLREPLSTMEMERRILEYVPLHHSYLIIEEVPGDRYYLSFLKELLKGPLGEMKSIVLESRDDRLKGLGEWINVIELG